MPVQQMLNFVFGTCNACPGFDTKGAVPVGKFPLPAQVRINIQHVYCILYYYIYIYIYIYIITRKATRKLP